MSQNNFEYYQEITLIPSEEINSNFLMNKIFSKLHLIFVEYQNKGMVDIGISFPDYSLKNLTLGNKIRIFFEKENQGNILLLKDEFKNYDDYIHITNIREIPKVVSYSIFSRKQNIKSNIRLAKRAAKRQNIEFSKMLSCYEDFSKPEIKLPYIKLYSSSTHQTYSIYIQKIESEYKKGQFNSFGLSSNSTVPIF